MDRQTIDRLSDNALRLRRLAQLHDAFGEHQQAAECRELAELEEGRARRLELRGRAA